MEGVGRPRAPHAPHRGALLRGRPAARARFACARPPSRSATPRWRVVFRIVLPTAASGLVTGSLLAVARAAGETAPLLFTASLRLRHQLRPSQAHELAAPADLLRRTTGPGPSPGACLGRRADARGPAPPAHPLRAPPSKQERPHDPRPSHRAHDRAVQSRSDSGAPSPPGAAASAAADTTADGRSAAPVAGSPHNRQALNACYGTPTAVKDVSLDFARQPRDGHDRPLGLRQVDARALHQPHA